MTNEQMRWFLEEQEKTREAILDLVNELRQIKLAINEIGIHFVNRV